MSSRPDRFYELLAEYLALAAATTGVPWSASKMRDLLKIAVLPSHRLTEYLTASVAHARAQTTRARIRLVRYFGVTVLLVTSPSGDVEEARVNGVPFNPDSPGDPVCDTVDETASA